MESKKKFKLEYFALHSNELKQIRCPDTGEWCDWSQSQVDHVAPNTFDAIFKSFLAFMIANDIDPNEMDILCKGDNVVTNELQDPEFRAIWIEYHDARATYQVVSKKANLSLRRKSGDEQV